MCLAQRQRSCYLQALFAHVQTEPNQRVQQAPEVFKASCAFENLQASSQSTPNAEQNMNGCFNLAKLTQSSRFAA